MEMICNESGVELQVSIATIAIVDEQLQDIITLPYKNGTIIIVFPYFESQVSYDPSMKVLFSSIGGNNFI